MEQDVRRHNHLDEIAASIDRETASSKEAYVLLLGSAGHVFAKRQDRIGWLVTKRVESKRLEFNLFDLVELLHVHLDGK